MKLNELMVKNKLYDKFNKIVTVSATYIDKNNVLILEKPSFKTLNVDVFPIPLTEEILLKCGFKKINDRGYCSDEEKKTIYSCGLVDIAFSNENFFLWVEVDEDQYYSFCWTKIEYLHQLQNIVFSISGTELEINL